MTSPDLPAPADLTLHSVDETQLVDAMVTSLQLAMPDWDPQEGATEILLMESMALTIGQFVFALNQLPGVVLDGLIALQGIARNPAVPSIGQLTVTVASSLIGTQILPAGARFRVQVGSDTTVDMLAAEQVTINPADSLTAVVNVTAETAGSTPNGVPVGTVAVMVDPYTWIESAIVTQAFGAGGDIESDELFYARAAAVLQGQSTTLVTDVHYAVRALRNPAVGRAKAFGRWDGVSGKGTMQGHVTVAVAGPDGADTSAAVRGEVQTDLALNAVAGLQVHVVSFTHTAMALAVTYRLAPGYTEIPVSAAVEVALRAWLSPASWPLDNTLTSVNQIILKIGTVPGVDDVIAVTGWAPITDGSTLPSITSITLTAA